MKSSSAFFAALILCALFATGCEGRSSRLPAGWDGVVRDSAGVSIVENTAVGEVPNLWAFGERPEVDIGVLAGPTQYELYEPRFALRLSDGRIVVGDNGSLTLRYYDADGNHIAEAGGRGQGPGELNRISAVFRHGHDTVGVYDQTQRRISVFDPEGAFVRAVTLARADRAFFPVIGGRTEDGFYVGLLTLQQVSENLPDGLSRDSVMLIRINEVGEVHDTIGIFPNRVRDTQMRSVEERRFRGPAEVAFSPRLVWTVADDKVYIGNSERYELRVYSAEGDFQRVIRKSHTPVPVTADDRHRLWLMWREIYAGRLNNPEIAYFLRTVEESPLPEAFPAFDPDIRDDRGRRVGAPLIVDRAKNLWVADFRKPGDDVPTWSVFDPMGRYRGFVTGPASFHVTEIDEDYALGWWTDSLDVAHVSSYRLTKEPG